MKQKRPINLDLTTLKFPPMAIASILHRISGVALFLLFPGALYWLSQSLQSEASFQHMLSMMQHPLLKLLTWFFCTALAYHLLAGIRHLFMDLGFGEGLPTGRYTAVFVIVLALVLTILLGIWI